MATAQAHVMEVSRGSARSGICAALCIRRTLCRHVTIGTPCTIRQKHSKPLVYQSSQVYQDCTNSVPIVKNSLKTAKTAKMTIGVRIVTGLPRLYQQCTNRQKQSKDSQNSKNDHWCTNRHMSTHSPPNTQSPPPRPESLRAGSENMPNFVTFWPTL